MPLTLGNLEIHMGPDTLGAPDDLRAAIVGFIDGATSSLDIAVQELDCRDIADAILRARARGVRARVVLEADYLVSPRRRNQPFQPGGRHEPNREIHDALLRAKAWVRSDFNPGIFHQKFIIRDKTSVLTGSTNFTDTGVTNNLNHVIIVHDREVAAVYAREYRDIRRGNFGKQSQAPKTPPELTVSGVRVKVAFAPDHNPEMEIMKQMTKARQRIDFAVFTFAQSSGIDDLMTLRAGEAGFTLRGLFDGMAANQTWAASKGLASAGVQVRVVKKKAPLGKLHHKLMVLDRRVVIVGSFNYTGPANHTNDENILVLGDLDDSTPAVIAAEQQVGQYALDEIDRIWTTHGSPMT